MQKLIDSSRLLVNSTGASHSEKDGCTAPASNNSSNYFLISNYFLGLCLYIDFYMGSAPSSRGTSYTSPRFWLGGVRVGSMPGNTL